MRAASATQAFERADHRVASGQLRAARVRTELTLPREPHHDHRGEDAEQDLRDEARDEEAGPRSALIAQQHAIDDEADDAREEDDECIHDALQQRERHHVAVRYVADLMA